MTREEAKEYLYDIVDMIGTIGMERLTGEDAEKAQIAIDTLADVPDTNVGDINKFIDGLEEIFADIRERHVDDSVCGLCEYDGAYIGQSGDWCNECPGFDRDDCFKLSDICRKEWIDTIIKSLSSAQPERKTGRWILWNYPGEECAICSACGEEYDQMELYIGGNDYPKHCPNCGVAMRGDE